MAIYNLKGQTVNEAANTETYRASAAFYTDGRIAFIAPRENGQTYLGGYIEIQPDSWDGITPVTGEHVSTSDATAWGFPMSLSQNSKNQIKTDILNGTTGIKYIRFPLGFAYRGYRNIDANSGLARNIGERWDGQNSALNSWFSEIVAAGGGLAPQYWCPAPHWLTSGSYSGQYNELTAGGSYPRSTSLASIRLSDSAQYNQQIDDFTDAIINDLQYLNTNIAPVVMFGLANEPIRNNLIYGSCYWTAQVYNDVLYKLCQKFVTYFPNIKIHVASSDEVAPFDGVASTFIENHRDLLWGFSHHSMHLASGEQGDGADSYYKSNAYANMVEDKSNVFINEYEYFTPNTTNNNFKCANNMVHLIDELVYGGAEVLHPVIHICKPTGQSASSTNTVGYCLYSADLQDGSISVNPWAYNSWKMFNDNLPIGSTILKNFFVHEFRIALVGTIANNKLRFFIANSGNNNKTISIYLDSSKTFSVLLYNLENIGISQPNISGQILDITVPAYSGLCLIQN